MIVGLRLLVVVCCVGCRLVLVGWWLLLSLLFVDCFCSWFLVLGYLLVMCSLVFGVVVCFCWFGLVDMCLLYVVRCVLFVGCWFVVRCFALVACLLLVDCSLLLVVGCVLRVVCRSLFVVRWLLVVECCASCRVLFAVRCVSFLV